MDAYCTVRDVRLALTPGAVETDQESAASLEDYQLQDAIEEAQGIVDSHVLSRYQIIVVEIEVENPADANEVWVFQVAPAPIRGLTRDVAAYLATLTWNRSNDISKDDPIRLRYNMAMDMLTAIRDGKFNLLLPAVGENPSGVFVYNTYEPALFSMEDVGLASYPNAEYQRYIYAKTAMI